MAVAILCVWALDRAYPPPLHALSVTSTAVLDTDGNPLRLFLNQDGRWRLPTRVDDVPTHYLDLLLTFEDRRFHAHPGVDPLALGRAIVQTMRHGRVVSGGSTVTMQVVRLLEPRPRTVASKLIEMARALQLEWHHSKAEILGMYLTLAPFGGNIEGLRAASLLYFGKEPRALDISEAALLVGLPQRPEAVRPDRFADAARSARDKVLDRAVSLGLLSFDRAAEAKAEPIPTARAARPDLAPHLAVHLHAMGLADERSEIRTSILSRLQTEMERLAVASLAGQPSGGGLAILVADWRTGDVLAWVGAPDMSSEARHGQVDMVRAIRSPGSALKPFIYGLAFDDRVAHPDTLVNDRPRPFAGYAPDNFDRTHRGEVTAAQALRQSLNVPAVALLDAIGPLRFDSALRTAGVVLRRPRSSDDSPGLPLALGGAGISLFDLVTLYAGLADDGRVKPLRVLTGSARPQGTALLSPGSATAVAQILLNAAAPDGRVMHTGAVRGVRIAAKTGTSYGFRDAWAIGFDGRHVAGVWVGRPDGTPIPGQTGRDAALPVLYRVFETLPPNPLQIQDQPMGRAPLALRRLADARDPSALPSVFRSRANPLRIQQPIDGSIIAAADIGVTVSRTDPPGHPAFPAVTLTAEGGRRPLVWLVDGRPIATARHRRDGIWEPTGPGRYRITVLDADGQATTVSVDIRTGGEVDSRRPASTPSAAPSASLTATAPHPRQSGP